MREFRHYLGVAYFKTGDLKQAQEQLTRARELNPKDSATHFDLALVFLSQQDYMGAADELEAAIKLDPSNALCASAAGASVSEFESQLAGGSTSSKPL